MLSPYLITVSLLVVAPRALLPVLRLALPTTRLGTVLALRPTMAAVLAAIRTATPAVVLRLPGLVPAGTTRLHALVNLSQLAATGAPKLVTHASFPCIYVPKREKGLSLLRIHVVVVLHG